MKETKIIKKELENAVNKNEMDINRLDQQLHYNLFDRN